jgi:hypothetical protein
MFKEVQNRKAGLCPAYHCPNKTGAKKKYCPRHHSQKTREAHPESYFFNLLKQNAKRRGKAFSLSLGDFKKFCADTGYLKNKGKKATSASIDRIDPAKGYELGNIQVLSLSDNSKKMHTDKDFPF